jgi:predicted PurR-regulated permease PerM
MNPLSLKRINSILFFSVLVCVILFFAKKILIPITFAIFFAMLFAPFCNWLEKKGIKRVFTSIISILITLSVAAGIVLLVLSQGKTLAEKFPIMKEKGTKMVNDAKAFVNERFGMNEQKQDQIVGKQLKSASQSSGSLIKKSLVSFSDFITAAVLVILFMFLFLLQREKYEAFFLKLCGNMPVDDAHAMIQRICNVSQQYLRGRIISIGIFTVCFTVGFIIVGLENAFLLAFIASVLTIIPYVGSLIGGLLPFAVALVTADNINVAIGALAVVAIVQAFDNYFIEPYIIGGGVSINGFFTILILVVGSAIWGVAGMILFIPVLGVVKVVLDSFPSLQPYGFLIGDQKGPKPSARITKILKNRFKVLYN